MVVKHFRIVSIANNIIFSHLLITSFFHFLNSGIELILSYLIWFWKKQNEIIISNSSAELLSAVTYVCFQSIINSLENQTIFPHLNTPWTAPIWKKHGLVFITHPQNFSLCKAIMTKERKKQAYSTFYFESKSLQLALLIYSTPLPSWSLINYLKLLNIPY